MAGKKYWVTYFALFIYVLCVLLVSLLVALLVSLAGVNRTACNSNNARNFAENNVRNKRNTEDFYERLEVLKKHVQPNPLFKNLKEIPSCPEIFQYNVNGTLWEDPRLPTYIKPTRYEVEFYRPYFPQKIYNGEVAIYLDITEDIDTIIVHANTLNVIYPSLYDNAENSIALKCADYYPLNEYFILRTTEKIQVDQGPLRLKLYFNGFLDVFESGLFLVDYKKGATEFNGNLMTSHFEPLDARKAFPCFDEPSMKAVFSVVVNHPNYTIAASNMPVLNVEPTPGRNNTLRTTFEDTPRIPAYLLGITVFNQDDFASVTRQTGTGRNITIWALQNHVNNGYADAPLDLAINIFDSIEYFLYINSSDIGPSKIDMVALPEYPDDAVAHWGIPIFRETKLLFKNDTVTEAAKQNIALLIAKQFAQFWVGNSVTFKWWDELWLQEGLSDYMKYKFVDFAYQEWRVNEQFITEELINILVKDAYPSSHPVIKPINYFYDIEQLFDDIESSKVAAVLRMIEYEIGDFALWRALTNYFEEFEFGTGDPNFLFEQFGNIRHWSAKDFADRWFLQPNYPLLEVEIKYDETNDSSYITINQKRNLITENSLFGLDQIYPSPFDFIWYVPVKCVFGFTANDTELYYATFEVETKTHVQYLPDNYKWMHCDEFFTGYYMLDYTRENWEYLAEVLRIQNPYFEAPERANIIHNIFVNAKTKTESYYDLKNVLSYLRKETDYLPWKTVSKHLKDMVDILEYRPSFYQVSTYFNFELRGLEQSLDLWAPSTNHIEQLTKATILDLACRLQDFDCLKNSSYYWQFLYNSLQDGSDNIVPIHVRPIAYNYHFQNTYNIRDWDLVFIKYETTDDTQEQERLLEALTFTRLPSQLARFLESQQTDGLKSIDLEDAVNYFAQNPLGREIIWNFFRSNQKDLIDTYGLDSPILGRILLEIVSSFEDEFMFYELVRFIIYTPSGASQLARFMALDMVSINLQWLFDREKEIQDAFGLGHSANEKEIIFFKRERNVKRDNPLISSEVVKQAKEYFEENQLLNVFRKQSSIQA